MQLPLQMAGMAGRIAGVRGELQAALESRCPDKDWSFITKQIGMFSFTGMTPQQVITRYQPTKRSSNTLV
jgi:aspartate aminotransferase